MKVLQKPGKEEINSLPESKEAESASALPRVPRGGSSALLQQPLLSHTSHLFTAFLQTSGSEQRPRTVKSSIGDPQASGLRTVCCHRAPATLCRPPAPSASGADGKVRQEQGRARGWRLRSGAQDAAPASAEAPVTDRRWGRGPACSPGTPRTAAVLRSAGDARAGRREPCRPEPAVPPRRERSRSPAALPRARPAPALTCPGRQRPLSLLSHRSPRRASTAPSPAPPRPVRRGQSDRSGISRGLTPGF
ncbi:uncharacterized protein LOC131906569 [Peromyscus eremicus]|uniref:uncharacterized protein LOC131906569 n=1 Tax=Peromyscus eremicus TaxID=42410 RepID=UPI0027DB9932|nr:uncharacterized protein LOC131906569 [Peromyscus eremicus]